MDKATKDKCDRLRELFETSRYDKPAADWTLVADVDPDDDGPDDDGPDDPES